tara:strand:+ start:158 stop:1189 length:1032 start_codon:yes stop_codon:yes gene_type:complete
MSNMFEQAIIDATALKEAALKNAEAEIVEKYAPEVKKVMESILEAEDEDLADEDALDMGMPMDASVEDPTAMELPLGAAAGENACPCPDEDEEVVLDLPGLAAIVAAEEPAIDDLENTETALDLDNAEEELPLEEEDVLSTVVAELLGEEEIEENTETLEEEETVEEVSLEEGCSDEEKVSEEKQTNESVDLSKIAGKTKELLGTIKALQEQNDNFKEGNTKLLSKMNEQKDSIQKLTTTLEELSLQNAKLLYVNEVLKTDSLNERQKQIAVEALQEAKSVEHAKTVFDTLQSTVVSTKRQTGRPESLSEVVSNKTSIKMPRRKEQKISNPHENRWKLLAGIK